MSVWVGSPLRASIQVMMAPLAPSETMLGWLPGALLAGAPQNCHWAKLGGGPVVSNRASRDRERARYFTLTFYAKPDRRRSLRSPPGVGRHAVAGAAILVQLVALARNLIEQPMDLVSDVVTVLPVETAFTASLRYASFTAAASF